MEEETKPTSTPRKRRSFGAKDLRKLHRKSETEKTLKAWAPTCQATFDLRPTEKVEALLKRRSR